MVLSIRNRQDLSVRLSQTTTRLTVLLRDYGYRVAGDSIIQIGEGCCRDSVFGRCRNVFDAAERLCPIIAHPGYTARFTKITTPTP
jgi:hypothetical protein